MFINGRTLLFSMVKVELFISTTCPHCPKAKTEVSRALKRVEDVEFKKYRVGTPEGKEKAAQYHLLGVPAVFIDGQMLKGTIDEDSIVDMIKRKLNPKESFFSRIFKK